MSQGHSNYLSSLCLPPLSALHMPMLIPRRPKGRLQDYPCVSWGRQDAGRHISSGWVEADDCNKLFMSAPSFLWVCLILQSAGGVAVGRWPCWPARLLLMSLPLKPPAIPACFGPRTDAGQEGMTWWKENYRSISKTGKLLSNVSKVTSLLID